MTLKEFKIKHRYTGAVLYAAGGETLRDVVVGAVKKGADLSGADLGGADLNGAYLGGAYLGGANLNGAYLRGADLGGADLNGAYLRGAYLGVVNLGGVNLNGANLRGAELGDHQLVGDQPILMIGPIGSRCDYLTAYLTDQGVKVRAGCFFGSLDEFRAAVAKTHGNSNHGREYAAAITMIDAHAAIWYPAEEADKARRVKTHGVCQRWETQR